MRAEPLRTRALGNVADVVLPLGDLIVVASGSVTLDKAVEYQRGGV